MKITVRDIKNSRIPAALGICETKPQLLAWLNESVQRLRTKALFIGSYGKLKICATDGCVTLPGLIASIERVAICGQPIPIHDMWYEFLDNGLGVRNMGGCGQGSCGAGESNLRGYFPTFGDIRGASKKLRFACDFSSDVGKKVLALGYDENRNWIRTMQDGVYADGEVIVLSQSPGTDSTKFFDGGVTSVQFLSDRDGQVWLWERDTIANTSRLIGSYQYWETNPNYARYLFPSILSQQTNGGCNTTMIELIGRLEYVPVKNDNDVVMFGNVPALKNMMVAVKQYEEAVSTEDLKRAAAFEVIALKELDQEIEYYLGEGREVGMNIKGPNVGRTVPIEALL